MKGCIFCQIISGESPSSIFYEDDLILGLVTIEPIATGHALIIPRQHISNLADLDENTGRHLWTIAHRTAIAIRNSGIRCEGINLYIADEKAASQEIFHLHLHVFPRYEGDSFKLEADWDTKPSRIELDHVADMIKVSFDQLRSDTLVDGS